MMGYPFSSWERGGFGGAILMWIILIALIVIAVRLVVRSQRLRESSGIGYSGDRPVEIAKKRYARARFPVKNSNNCGKILNLRDLRMSFSSTS